MSSNAAQRQPELSDYLRAVLQALPANQLFAVISWGCAATSWLADVLNSHPDIFCVHAGNWSWHAFGGAPALDGVPYLRVVGSQGHAHAAAGDVHGVNRAHVPGLRAAYGQRFNAAVVTRDPMPRFRSQMRLFYRWEQYRPWDLGYIDSIIGERDIPLPDPSAYANRFVVHAANMLNAIVDERAVGRVYRAEDITTSPAALGDLVCDLTRGKVVPDKTWLEAAILRKPTHVHSSWGEAPERELQDWEIEVVRHVVSREAWRAYEELGYETPALL